MKSYVLGFMFSKDEKEVLLIEKQTPAWQKGFLNGVGGKVEAGEESIQAMVREFEEETGLSTEVSEWQIFLELWVASDAKIDIYATHSDLLYDAKTMEQEIVMHCEVAHLPANVMPNLRWQIPLSLDKKVSFEVPVVVREIET